MTKPKRIRRIDLTPDVSPETQEALSAEQSPKPAKRKRPPQPPIKVTFVGLTPEVIVKAQRALIEMELALQAKAAAK